MSSAADREERPNRTKLSRSLLKMGALTPDWAPALEAVPRSEFLPDLMWPYEMATGRSVPICRGEDEAAWYRFADADVPIVTQWDDGEHHRRAPGTVPTSSASMPSVVFAMLKDLDVQPDHQVLEIGTGTGWNAALLAHRLGADHVTTIDVDQAVAASASAALDDFGVRVRVVTGDGSAGYPPSQPYDRIIATCGLRRIPYTWVEQTRPGGLIVTPWGTHYSNRDAVVRLTVSQDGAAHGRFTRPVEFMKLRAQRLTWAGHNAYVPPDVIGGGKESTTTLTENAFPAGPFASAPFAMGLLVRDCWHSVAEKRDGTRPIWFYGLTDRSWAVAIFRDGHPEAKVYQYGGRRLWDEVEAAWRWWDQHGRPDINRFGLTITTDGETTWLDVPDNPVPRTHSDS